MSPLESLSLEDGELSTVAGRAGAIAAEVESDGALVGIEDTVGSAMPGSRSRRSHGEAVETVNEKVTALAAAVTETAENAEYSEIELLSQDQQGATTLFPWALGFPGPTP
ncbi:MAG: hypothetical protein ACTHZ5_01060 [Micrococcaceae bacterium]